jgi:hypothetical protein
MVGKQRVVLCCLIAGILQSRRCGDDWDIDFERFGDRNCDLCGCNFYQGLKEILGRRVVKERINFWVVNLLWCAHRFFQLKPKLVYTQSCKTKRLPKDFVHDVHLP